MMIIIIIIIIIIITWTDIYISNARDMINGFECNIIFWWFAFVYLNP